MCGSIPAQSGSAWHRAEDADGLAAGLVALAAEDDGVDAPREQARNQNLALMAVEEGAYKLVQVHLWERTLGPAEPIPDTGLLRSGFVDPRRENEVVFGQPAGRVRPELDVDSTPSQVQVRVMSLRLCDWRDPVHERHRIDEVLKAEVL